MSIKDHELFVVWDGIKMRVGNNKYGKRYLSVSLYSPWYDFMTFVTDIENEIGPRPQGRTPSGKRPLYTLDRIDNTGNYVPGNIRWLKYKGQANNRTQGWSIGASHPKWKASQNGHPGNTNVRNTIWINNGILNRRIHGIDPIPEGFRKGRLYRQKL